MQSKSNRYIKMSKKLRITLTAAVMAVIMLVMSVSVCAVDHWYAYAYPYFGTVKYTGLLRTVRNPERTAFTLLGATARIDSSGTGGPTSVSIDVQIIIEGYAGDTTPFTNEFDPARGLGLNYGDYLSTPNQLLNESSNIDEVRGMFYYKDPEATSYIKVITTEKCVHDEPGE